MFSQILVAVLGVWLIYVGIVEKSIFDIVMGSILITLPAGMFYAAKNGFTIQEEFVRWRTKRSIRRNR